jgi:hypothetical protein
MRFGRPVRSLTLVVLTGMALLWPHVASAQSSVGGGPLTSSLPDVEPTIGILTLGRVRFAPGLTIREIGWDSNVFDESESESPKEDWVAAVQPDVSAFTRLRFLRLSAYAGSELTYYNTYESERSVGHNLRARADVLLSRVRPFIGVGQVETRTRPNGEIDTRADRQEDEISGGLAFDVSPNALLYGAAYRMSFEYEDAIESGVNLSETMTRDDYNYEAGLKTDLTPLLSMQLAASYRNDEFTFEPIRNSQSWGGLATFRFAPEAIINGVVTAGYRDMDFVDPELNSYRGFVGTASIAYSFLEVGRLSAALTRGVEYSFDAGRAYYVENSAMLAYTHRLFGAVDAQVMGMHAAFDYEARSTLPAHTDTLDTAAGSVGYNLRNKTRIALNYEYARRRSPVFAERNYQRRRAYLSWQFAF